MTNPAEVPSRTKVTLAVLPSLRATATTVFEASSVEFRRRTTSPSGLGAWPTVSEPEWRRPLMWASLVTTREEALTVPVKAGLLFNWAKAEEGRPLKVAVLTLARPEPSPSKTFPELVSERGLA